MKCPLGQMFRSPQAFGYQKGIRDEDESLGVFSFQNGTKQASCFHPSSASIPSVPIAPSCYSSFPIGCSSEDLRVLCHFFPMTNPLMWSYRTNTNHHGCTNNITAPPLPLRNLNPPPPAIATAATHLVQLTMLKLFRLCRGGQMTDTTGGSTGKSK